MAMRVRAWAVVACLIPWRAWGQTQTDESLRRQLITQAGDAHDAGDHPRALDLARHAWRLGRSPSLRAIVAREESEVGLVVEAYRDSDTCVRELEMEPDADHEGQFMRLCRALERSLAARVARLVVRVDGDVPGARVRVGEQELSRGEWGVAQVRLPGSATVTAEASGRVPFREQVEVEGGRTEVVVVRLEAAPRVPPVVVGATQPVEHPTTPDDASPQGAGAWPWVTVGAGAALFGAAAGVHFLGRVRAEDELTRVCGSTSPSCPVATTDLAEEARRYQDDASTFSALTNVFLAAGTAVTTGGLIWWFVTRNRGRSERPATRVTFHGGREGMFVGVSGRM